MALSAPADITNVLTSCVSTGSRQALNGTALGMVVNRPGGTWVWGAGWDWGAPFIPATWDPPGIPTNIASLAEEKTALGVPIGSNGGYAKPAHICISAEIQMTGNLANTAGVGFWSTMPARTNTAPSLSNFTGLVMNENNGTLQVCAAGSLVGSAVSVGPLQEGVFYTVRYTVHTASGVLSDVEFAGSPVVGLVSTAFTDNATALAGVLSGAASRAYLRRLAVAEVVPGGLRGILMTLQ